MVRRMELLVLAADLRLRFAVVLLRSVLVTGVDVAGGVVTVVVTLFR
jgi:hypothetical protein